MARSPEWQLVLNAGPPCSSAVRPDPEHFVERTSTMKALTENGFSHCHLESAVEDM